MEFTHPQQSDLPQLQALWQQAFPQDSPAFAQRFFSLLFRRTNCFVAKEQGRILSVAYAIPYTARLDNEPHRVAYLYAVATQAEHRGQGIFAALHRHLCRELTQRGYEMLFLIPETPELFSFWLKKMGYHSLFYHRSFFVPSLPPSFRPTPPDLPLLYSIYCRSQAQSPQFHLELDYASFCLTMEDKHVALDVENKTAAGYVIYTPRKEGYVIREYHALGKRKLSGAGRTVRSALAMPLADRELFDRLYKTKPRLNFLLN